MSTRAQEPLAALRGLLSRPPSERNFERLMEFFIEAVWESRAAMEVALEYAEEHLDSWPPNSRKFGAYRLWRRCPQGSPSACFRLIRYLDLGSNSEGVYRFGPEGGKALAQSPHLARIARLYFWGNGLGDEGTAALAQSPHLGQLQRLTLLGNGITDVGALALARSTALPQLVGLTLSHNSIGDPGALALAQSEQLSGLRDLHLNQNQVGEAGALALAFAGHLSPSTRRYWLQELPSSTLLARAQLAGVPNAPQLDHEALVEALL